MSGEALSLRFAGPLSALSAEEMRELLDRSTSSDPAIREQTAAIVARVRREGDEALRAMASEYDGVRLAAVEVPRDAPARALAALEPALRRALQRAAGRSRLPLPAYRLYGISLSMRVTSMPSPPNAFSCAIVR